MDKHTALQLGRISNRLTDMIIEGAPREEIAKVVSHSMEIIDGAKKSNPSDKEN